MSTRTSRTTRALATKAAAVALGISALIAPAADVAGAVPPMPSAPAAAYCPAADAYRLGDCDGPPALPETAVGGQLAWFLPYLTDPGGLTAEEVAAHLSAGLLTVTPAEVVVGLTQGVVAELGPMDFVGFAYPPRTEDAVALLESAGGVRGALGISVDRDGRVDSLDLAEATPTIVPQGPHSGWFDVGGRRLFLHCTGTGSPTVVFENGLAQDWAHIQAAVTPTTRACSYDPPLQQGPYSRSDPAPTPRDARDRARDLSRLLRAAEVPGPVVLVGSSNGGLVSLLHASRYDDQVAGLVLVDPVHPEYRQRRTAMLRDHLDPETWSAFAAAACALPDAVRDPEQMDMCRSEAQTRRALRAHPLEPMPLSVLSHGRVPEGMYPPGWPADAEEGLWADLQAEVASLVPGAHHVVAAESDHDIPHQQPGLVVAEVERVVAAVRGGAA